MSVRCFIEQLGSIGPHRMISLVNEGARVAGARKRAVSVYLGEISSDEVLRAVAKGAA